MNIEISTSDPDAVDPEEIGRLIERRGYYVATVSVNEGQRLWENPDA